MLSGQLTPPCSGRKGGKGEERETKVNRSLGLVGAICVGGGLTDIWRISTSTYPIGCPPPAWMLGDDNSSFFLFIFLFCLRETVMGYVNVTDGTLYGNGGSGGHVPR